VHLTAMAFKIRVVPLKEENQSDQTGRNDQRDLGNHCYFPAVRQKYTKNCLGLFQIKLFVFGCSSVYTSQNLFIFNLKVIVCLNYILE
jgi:hypothetical protein